MRPLAALLLALAACSVPLSGGPCQSDLNCPSGQGCDPSSGTCVECNPNEFMVNPAHQTGGDPAYASRCWFGTLTAALAAAGATGQAAVVKAAGWSSGEVVFSQARGESFPLSVPANVSLTTTDSPPVPSRYVVELDASAAAAVQLREGSGLSGFTVRRGSGTAADGVLVACGGAGGVNVASVALDGKGSTGSSGITHGVRLTGPCGATVRGVSVANMGGAGIRVESSGTAQVTVSGSTMVSNADSGLQLRLNGSASAAVSGNEISGNAGALPYGGRTAGGVLIYSGVPGGVTFTGNRVYGNKGDQVVVVPNSNGWNLAGGGSAAACASSPPTYNVFACYDTTAGGVAVSSVSGGAVDARFNRWANVPPTGADFLGPVNATGPGNEYCPAVSCPP